MSAQHTPGPWKVDMNGCETSHGMPIIAKANGHLLAMLAERNEANARLIAAAPELLAALKARMETSPGQGPHYFSVIEQCRAAIAKAEGRAP